MSLHVEEVTADSGVEYVAPDNETRWAELEERGVERPYEYGTFGKRAPLAAICIWYDELVMVTGTPYQLRQFSNAVADLVFQAGAS